jgi:hypothetical protein
MTKERFTKKEIVDIRKKYKRGFSQVELANIYNAPSSTISDVCNHKTYDWVTTGAGSLV